MTHILILLLATLSLWDYPARWRNHVVLRNQFVAAFRQGDTETMVETCQKGVNLLPDDPTWHYNLACSLAYMKKPDSALDELEQAIDLGFRDADKIAADSDLQRLKGNARYKELIEYAREMARRPMLWGPMANCEATGVFGSTILMGEQNFAWNFDTGCFDAKLKLVPGGKGGNVGDLYMNRDGEHSLLKAESFPGLTIIKLDQDGRERGMDLNAPNMLFPYPVFGNCSRAFMDPNYWRSMPRALMTTESFRLGEMLRYYLSNQIWVYPANQDFGGQYGDVFQSVCPYFFVTQGASWSDQYYLKAALTASANLKPEVKAEIVKRGALGPVMQMLIHRNLSTVSNETDYVSAKAWPTVLPPNGLDMPRLVKDAKNLKVSDIAPVVPLVIRDADTPVRANEGNVFPECTYVTPLASAFILRADQNERTFQIAARGAVEYCFAIVHGSAQLQKLTADTYQIVLDKSSLSPTNRVDLAVFGRTATSPWGAPSFVSFSAVDPSAPYSDPALTVIP